jgi:hypothetical protein
MSGVVKGDMVVVALCQIMGWTYQQYHEQPTYFIELLLAKLEIDNRKQEAAAAAPRRGVR